MRFFNFCLVLVVLACSSNLIPAIQGCPREVLKSIARARIRGILSAFPELTDEIRNGQLGPLQNNNNNGQGYNNQQYPSGNNQQPYFGNQQQQQQPSFGNQQTLPSYGNQQVPAFGNNQQQQQPTFGNQQQPLYGNNQLPAYQQGQQLPAYQQGQQLPAYQQGQQLPNSGLRDASGALNRTPQTNQLTNQLPTGLQSSPLNGQTAAQQGSQVRGTTEGDQRGTTVRST